METCRKNQIYSAKVFPQSPVKTIKINKNIKNILKDDTNSCETENDDEWRKAIGEEIKNMLKIRNELNNYERAEHGDLIFEEALELEMENKSYKNLLIDFIRNGREMEFKAILDEFVKLINKYQREKQTNSAENEKKHGNEKKGLINKFIKN